MLFRPEKYFRPKTIDETVSLLVEYGERARLIAGGTDLLVDKPPEAECLIDITRLPLNYIRSDEEGVKIGALTTFRNLQTSSLIKDGAYGVLAEAAHEIGFVTTRNVATIGGNICNALPSADSPPALVALDAKIKIVGPAGERIIPLEEFFLGVKKTDLKTGDMLVEIQVPKQPARTGTAFLKIGRTRVDLAIVNTAVRVTLGADGVCEDVRIILGGGVGPTLIRARKAEVILRGLKLEDALIEEAAKTASEYLRPRKESIRASPEYKIEVSKVLVRRALKKAIERAKAGE